MAENVETNVDEICLKRLNIDLLTKATDQNGKVTYRDRTEILENSALDISYSKYAYTKILENLKKKKI